MKMSIQYYFSRENRRTEEIQKKKLKRKLKNKNEEVININEIENQNFDNEKFIES